MTEEQLQDLLSLGQESRHVEFKGSMPWSAAATKGKITKSILAMSNVRDGGVIVLGVERQNDGSYVPSGMNSADISTYDSGEVARYVQNYADPDARFAFQRLSIGGREFVVIEVNEFEEVPIVCRNNGPELTRGTLYTRTNVPETVPVPGETEMRELVEIAVDKGMRRFIQRLSDIGLIQTIVIPERIEDADMFMAERRDLGENA